MWIVFIEPCMLETLFRKTIYAKKFMIYLDYAECLITSFNIACKSSIVIDQIQTELKSYNKLLSLNFSFFFHFSVTMATNLQL